MDIDMVAQKIHCFLNKLEFRSVVFGGRVKQESTEKLSVAERKTTKSSPHMASSLESNPGLPMGGRRVLSSLANFTFCFNTM